MVFENDPYVFLLDIIPKRKTVSVTALLQQQQQKQRLLALEEAERMKKRGEDLSALGADEDKEGEGNGFEGFKPTESDAEENEKVDECEEAGGPGDSDDIPEKEMWTKLIDEHNVY